MTRNPVQPRETIFVKGIALKSMGKNIGKNLSGKYSQKLF